MLVLQILQMYFP